VPTSAGRRPGNAREVARRKAAGPATDSVNGLHADSQAGGPESRGAKSPRATCLSVYAGQTCIGFLLTRGSASIEAFDADDKSLGIFPDQKSAADAISKAAS
jgi:hypothetical protein